MQSYRNKGYCWRRRRHSRPLATERRPLATERRALNRAVGDDYVKERFKAHRRHVRKRLSEITKDKRVRGLLPEKRPSGADYRELAAQRLSHHFFREPAFGGTRQAKSEDGGGAGGATAPRKGEAESEDDDWSDWGPWQAPPAAGGQAPPAAGGAKDEAKSADNTADNDDESWGPWQPWHLPRAVGIGSKTAKEEAEPKDSKDDSWEPWQPAPAAGGGKDEAKSEEYYDESRGPWQSALAVGSGPNAKWSAAGDVRPNRQPPRAASAHQQSPIGVRPAQPQRPIGMSEEKWVAQQRRARRF